MINRSCLLIRLDAARTYIRAQIEPESYVANGTVISKMLQQLVDDINSAEPKYLAPPPAPEPAVIQSGPSTTALPPVPPYDPTAGTTATPMPRETPHINREPVLMTATALDVEDRSLFATAGDDE